MNLRLNSKKTLRKLGFSLFLAVLLFGCATSPKLPQTPVVKPTKTSAPSTPHIVENDSPPVENFSLQDANKILPQDVLQEVSFGGQGGGDDTTMCDDTTKIYSKPTLVSASVEAEWLNHAGGIGICGWREDEIVSLTITFPDGSISRETLEAYDTDGTAATFYDTPIPSVNDQIGTYFYLFEGESGKVSHSINVYIPTEPRLYYLYKEKTLEAFFLYGYSPNERVRLLVYGSPSDKPLSASLTAWSEYYVDRNGQLIIKIANGFSGSYFAVGDISGVNRNSGYDSLAVTISSSSNATSCNSNILSRLQVGEYAYVATDPPLKQRVREKAKTSSSIVGLIPPGNSMKILDGPKCADGWAWWKVQSIEDPKLVGWTSEGDEVYWLIPCDSLSSCP